jgi:hypothetical protein
MLMVDAGRNFWQRHVLTLSPGCDLPSRRSMVDWLRDLENLAFQIRMFVLVVRSCEGQSSDRCFNWRPAKASPLGSSALLSLNCAHDSSISRGLYFYDAAAKLDKVMCSNSQGKRVVISVLWWLS